MDHIKQFIRPALPQRWKNGSSNTVRFFWYSGLILLILWGWMNRNEGLLTAENGLGYSLGIIGSLFMLSLLSYSLRKRWKRMRSVFTVKFWFRLHMTLGIVGPVAILFHCNFRLASLNSSVALACMLLVAGSGLIGRYLYKKIHYGLYGEEIKVKNLLKEFKAIEEEILAFSILPKQKEIAKKIFSVMEQLTLKQNTNKSFFSIGENSKNVKKTIKNMSTLIKHISNYHEKHSTSPSNLKHTLNRLNNDNLAVVEALNRIPTLRLSERLFSLWHVIHIPIYIIMIISVLVHVWVVHMY